MSFTCRPDIGLMNTQHRKMKKQIIVWLALIEDETIRKKAIANCNPHMRAETAPTMDIAVNKAFEWKDTPEGKRYWKINYNPRQRRVQDNITITDLVHEHDNVKFISEFYSIEKVSWSNKPKYKKCVRVSEYELELGIKGTICVTWSDWLRQIGVLNNNQYGNKEKTNVQRTNLSIRKKPNGRGVRHAGAESQIFNRGSISRNKKRPRLSKAKA